MARTRRGVLTLLVASTGCLGFGTNSQVTPGAVEETPDEQTATASPTDSPTAPPASETPTETASPTQTATETASPTPTESSTPTQTPTETTSPTPTASPTPTPTATPRQAQAPPEGSLTLNGVTVEVRPGRRNAEATVTVSLSSDSPVTFTLIELRVDLYYDRPFGGRRQVGTGYILAEDDSGVGGSISGTFSFDDDRLDGSEPDSRYSVELQYRRVRYEEPA